MKIQPILYITLLLTGFQTATWAESTVTKTTDEAQPVHISADSLEASEQKGVSTYKGNVIVIQGSLKLQGDSIRIQHPGNALSEVFATGKPASFRRFSPEENAWLTGHADQIEYNADKMTLLLLGDAEVSQPGRHVIRGPKLFYDLNKKTMQAKGDAKQSGRISVTLTPSQDKAE